MDFISVPAGNDGALQESGVRENGKKKARLFAGFAIYNLGNVLLSHTVTHAVPSALKDLTSVFGMGTGVSPSPWSPRTLSA